MKKLKLIFSLAFILALISSCVKEPNKTGSEGGVELKLVTSFKAMTKVAELPIGQINNDNKGLKNIGLYIYYAKDYNSGDLSKPYVRNMECNITGNMLKPLTGEPIYIYDEMVLVAFYPYNGNVGNFTTKVDEQSYPISMGDYSQQVYIPYRGQSSVNPTVAYKANLQFIPVQTSKVEVVIVGGTTFTNPQILPNIAPVGATSGDKREKMVDLTNVFTNSGGGQSATQFVSYLWTTTEGATNHDPRNNPYTVINVGDVIFQSDELTLTATQKINLSDDRVFRYGYNMVTGEIFVPTSSSLVYDIASLRNSPAGYQVCDIDLSSVANWVPINMGGNNFDGGGHQISGMTITSLPASGNVGLFGQLQGNAVVRNVNLVSPVITINAGNSSAYVGAICGLNNFQLILTPDQIAAMRQAIINSLPPDVATPVIDALLADAIKKATSGSSVISGCKVSNATITLTGKSLKAGLFCGVNGNPNAKATIKDSYATGTISANIGVGVLNDTCFVAGFVGYNNATISQSYSTGSASAEAYVTSVPSPIKIDKASGFCKLGSSYADNSGAVTSCFTLQTNTTPPVSQFPTLWPSWSVYAGKWPIYDNGSHAAWRSVGTAPSIYPTLVWEK